MRGTRETPENREDCCFGNKRHSAAFMKDKAYTSERGRSWFCRFILPCSAGFHASLLGFLVRNQDYMVLCRMASSSARNEARRG